MKHRLNCRYYDVLYACAFPRNKWCSIRHSHSPYACLFDWFVVYVFFYLKTGRIQKLSRFSSKNYDRVVVTRDILETSSLTSGFCWVFFHLFCLFVCVFGFIKKIVLLVDVLLINYLCFSAICLSKWWYFLTTSKALLSRTGPVLGGAGPHCSL